MKKWWLLSLGLIFIDQVSKILILKYLPQLVSFNQGISFGLFPWRWWLVINLLILGLVIFLKRESFASWLIIAGGLGNILDRIIRGRVVDFINLKIFPVFNLADIFIVLGVTLLLFDLLF